MLQVFFLLCNHLRFPPHPRLLQAKGTALSLFKPSWPGPGIPAEPSSMGRENRDIPEAGPGQTQPLGTEPARQTAWCSVRLPGPGGDGTPLACARAFQESQTQKPSPKSASEETSAGFTNSSTCITAGMMWLAQSASLTAQPTLEWDKSKDPNTTERPT